MRPLVFLTAFLIRYRGWLLLAAAILAMGAYLPASRLTLDRSIDTMFAPDDPLLPPYHKLKETFGGNDVVLCVYDDAGLLDEDQQGMQRLSKIGKRLAAVPGVFGILTLELPIGPRVVDPDSAVSTDVRAIFEGYTHGSDGRTACVACMLSSEPEFVANRERTVDELRQAMLDLPDGLSPGIVTGEPVMMVDAFRYVERDGRRLSTMTTLLLAIVIYLSFHRLRWVVIPILVVQLALLLTKGLLAVTGIQLTMVSSMLTAVVTVVGVATVIHVIVRFREGRDQGLSPMASLVRCGRLLIAPIFWACVTDAVGFGSLMVADVAPVRDFGLMMAIGALMVFVSAGLLVPGLVLFRSSRDAPARLWGESFVDVQLLRFVSAAKHHPRLVGISLLGLFLFSLLGIQRLRIETDFTRNFREHTPIVKSYELVESKLGGAGVCDIVLPAPRTLNWKYMRNVLELQRRLRERVQVTDEEGHQVAGLTKVLSLADAVISASPLELERLPAHGGTWSSARDCLSCAIAFPLSTTHYSRLIRRRKAALHTASC